MCADARDWTKWLYQTLPQLAGGEFLVTDWDTDRSGSSVAKFTLTLPQDERLCNINHALAHVGRYLRSRNGSVQEPYMVTFRDRDPISATVAKERASHILKNSDGTIKFLYTGGGNFIVSTNKISM